MSNNVVETLEVDVKLNSSDYKKRVDELQDMNNELEDSFVELQKEHEKTSKTLNNLLKGVGAFMGALAVATGLEKLVNDTARANDELGFLEKQLNLSANSIKSWQGAMAAGGGSAEGATNAFKNLTNGINNFVIRGDTGLLPYMNAVGVSMVDMQGHARKADDVMLDLADSFSKMSTTQAYSIGKDMGFDEGTIGTLIQGRDALKESLAYQNALYKSSEQDIKNSRELQKNRALLNSQWESFKTMLGNQLIPIFNKLAKGLLSFFEFMQRHQDTVKRVFGGLAILLSVSVIPLLTKALAPLLAFIKPFSPFIGVVTALAGAFILLYDDYKTWADGGNSLFNWDAFRGYFDGAKISVDNLKESLKSLWQEMKDNFNPTMDKGGQILRDLRDGNGKEAWKKTKEMVGEAGGQIGDALDVATGHKKGTARGINVISKNDQNFNELLLSNARAAGITDPKELAAFTAITAHETGDGRNLSENTNYSYRGWQNLAPNQRNVRNWLKSHNQDDFNKLSNQDKLNIMYNGMNGNRAGTDDGYKFRGRGGIQITGRAEYERIAKRLNRMDILDNPDIVATDKDLAAKTAVEYWKSRKNVVNAARSGNVAEARRLVNGGQIGMDDVMSRYRSLQNNASPLSRMPQNTSNSTSNQTVNNTTINVPNMQVTTSATTLTGATQDAMKQAGGTINPLIGATR